MKRTNVFRSLSLSALLSAATACALLLRAIGLEFATPVRNRY